MKAKYIGQYNGKEILWYGAHLFAGSKEETYQTFCRVPPHAALIFMHKGHIFFAGYN